MGHLQLGTKFRYDANLEWVNDCLLIKKVPILRILKVVPRERRLAEELKMIFTLGRHFPLMNWQIANPLHNRVYMRGPVSDRDLMVCRATLADFREHKKKDRPEGRPLSICR